MRKYYKGIIKEFEYLDYSNENGIIAALDLLLNIDFLSIRNEDNINKVMEAFHIYLIKEKMNLTFNINDIELVTNYFKTKDLEEIKNIFKLTSMFKINILFLNSLLKSQNEIFSEFTKDEFLYNRDFPAYNDLIFNYKDENDENPTLNIDFDNPEINVLDFTYLMLRIMVFGGVILEPYQSELISLFELDNLDAFKAFLMRHEVDLKNYNDFDASQLILGIIFFGQPNLNNLIEKLNIDVFAYKGIEPSSIFRNALLSKSLLVFEKYYQLNPKAFKLADGLDIIMDYDEELFKKTYELLNFSDIDFIMAYGPNINFDINMHYLLSQDNFDPNRISKELNISALILEKGNLSLIKYLLEKGGKIYETLPLLTQDNNVIYEISVYAYGLANQDQECFDWILNLVPKDKMIIDISPTLVLLNEEKIETLIFLYNEGYQDREYIKKNGKFLLDIAINDNLVESFKFLVSIFGPNSTTHYKMPLFHKVIRENNIQMFEYLLQYKKLNLDLDYFGMSVPEFIISSNFVHGVKRFIELGFISQNTSFNAPLLTSLADRKTMPEVYKMLSAIIPKYYYFKLIFTKIGLILFVILMLSLLGLLVYTWFM